MRENRRSGKEREGGEGENMLDRYNCVAFLYAIGNCS